MSKIQCILFLLILFSIKGWAQCITVTRSNAQVQGNTYGSTTSDYKEPYRAFDAGAGYDTSHWSTDGAGGSQWISTSFPESFSVCQISMIWGADQFPTSFSITATNDYLNWTVIKTVTYNSSNSFTLDIPDSGSFSVYQINLALSSGSTGYTLYNCVFKKRVANTPPDVSLIAPTSGTFIQGTNIQISATAQDNDSLGFVRKVEFYQDSLLLATDSILPYSYTGWTPATIRKYKIYAKATDNEGAITVSDTSIIDITSAPTSLKNWILTGSNINNSNTGTVFIGPIPSTSRGDTALKLSVNGNIYAKKLTVTQLNWADYVFDPAYKLLPLNDVAAFIQKNKRLPELPSASDVERNGIDVGHSQELLLRKIEELTLYVIAQNKEQQALREKLEKQNKRVSIMAKEMQQLKSGKVKK